MNQESKLPTYQDHMDELASNIIIETFPPEIIEQEIKYRLEMQMLHNKPIAAIAGKRNHPLINFIFSNLNISTPTSLIVLMIEADDQGFLNEMPYSFDHLISGINRMLKLKAFL